jgi:hypothetical protein
MEKNSPRIMVSAAMRSGSTLVSNILNAHRDLLIFENFHFQRFIYQDGKKLTKNLLKFKVYEMRDRLNLRYNYKINADKVINNVIKKGINYKNLYDELINDQAVINKVKIVGEDSALNWRFLDQFCKFYSNAKIIHLIRDPRSIFASWKKATYQKNDYWGCLFNVIDCMNYAINYQKKLKKKNYMVIKFEDILSNPEYFAKKICNFLNIKFEKNMIKPKKWSSLFIGKNASLGWSSIEKKNMDGFYKNRIDAWKNILTDEEINTIQVLMNKNMKQWGYNIYKIKNKKMNTFFKCVEKSNYLKNNFQNFLLSGEGSDLLKDDPTDPNTWGDGKKNKKKFKDTKKGKLYLKNIKKYKKYYQIT